MIVFTKGKIKSKGNASKIKLTLSGEKKMLQTNKTTQIALMEMFSLLTRYSACYCVIPFESDELFTAGSVQHYVL